jgi:outer membrane protein assembly factor BamD
MDAGSFDRAIKSLERVEGLGAGSLLAQQAQLDLAYLYWRTGERAQANTTIERFIKLNPSSPALDYAMYLRGAVNFIDNLGLLGGLAGQNLSERDQRASRDAFAAFKQLVEQFPDSKYSADARLRMQYIVNSLAEYELHVARYYMRRQAYVAAVNRAQLVVQEFPQTVSAEEALSIMVQSYDALQLKTLRDDAERVLRSNYPQSIYLGGPGTSGGARKPWWRFW